VATLIDEKDSTLRIKLMRMAHAENMPLPTYATDGAAGMDLKAAIAHTVTVPAGNGRVLIPTGLCIEVPVGYEAQVRPRSGLAAKHLVTVLNTPGTIDSDYRGEIKVILINHGDQPFKVEPGDRVAQLVIAPVVRVEWDEVAQLDDTSRGDGGFGSTGVRG
jgi:dUTP pyrophosphatase